MDRTDHSPEPAPLVGLYGGSFDPIHNGHLSVAERAREAFGLDEVWFIPAARPPHKPGKRLASGRDRVAMLELALADIPWARVEAMELSREGPSYTFDTVEALLARHPDWMGELHLLLGGDNLPGFPGWHRVLELLDLVQPIVLRREGDSAENWPVSEELQTLLSIGAALAATGLLAKLAWARSEGAAPKAGFRETRVPKVGGVALLVGLLVGPEELPWMALTVAFIIGAWDDWIDLPAGPKALWQLVPCGFLAYEVGGSEGLWLAALAWVGQNAINTWDHSDGFVCGLCLVGLPPPLAAPFAGVLPWNLVFRKEVPDPGSRGKVSLPWAYLGDSGSLMTGVLLAWHPTGRYLLILPLLDLARVVILRLAAGQPIWVGDRRHLGHRFENMGWPSKVGALLAAGAALPLAVVSERGWIWALAVCAVIWAGLIVASRPSGATGKENEQTSE